MHQYSQASKLKYKQIIRISTDHGLLIFISVTLGYTNTMILIGINLRKIQSRFSFIYSLQNDTDVNLPDKLTT